MESFLSRITFFKASPSPIVAAAAEHSPDSSDSPSLPVHLCTCPPPPPPPPPMKSAPVLVSSDQVSEFLCRDSSLKLVPAPSSRSVIYWPFRIMRFLDRKCSEPPAMAYANCQAENAHLVGNNVGVDQEQDGCLDPQKEIFSSSFSILGIETVIDQAGGECLDLKSDSFADVVSREDRNRRILNENIDPERNASSFSDVTYGNENRECVPGEDDRNSSPSPPLDCSKVGNDDSKGISSPMESQIGKSVDDSKLLARKMSFLAGLWKFWAASKRQAPEEQIAGSAVVSFSEDPTQILMDSNTKIFPEWSIPENTDMSLESGCCDADNACCGSDCCTALEVPFTKVVHTQESFSKFLQDASLFDMKVFAPLSLLCDMAYTIPKIQPGNLLKSHRLKFVTSSINKKAAIEANAKKGERSSTSSSTEASNDGSAKPGSSRVDNGLEIKDKETKMTAAKDLESYHSCPCEWFVCDDVSSCTRYLVIQGSETLASWQTNLSFEPTKFEGLDTLVHHGIYEAAKGLYEQVLPEIITHITKHGDCARIRLTGHSLGGSLAILLALMFQIRGVVTSKCMLPVVTFGSPCMMCGGDLLLRNLDLPRNHIQSIIMHQDIVPRAFSCDYPDYVAHVLKRLNGRFRDHPCLNSQKLLYAPMGQIFVLQPQENVAPPHALLPRGHGLYLLRHPVNGEDTKNEIELRAAQRAFLNIPHPLETLSDPGAYGLSGTISRDHNPSRYAEAIHTALKYEVKRLQRVHRQQRRNMLQPTVANEPSVCIKKGTPKIGLTVELKIKHGPLVPATSRTLTFMQSMNFSTSNPTAFLLGSMPILASYKNAVGRYARTIASKHVKVGMLFFVSLHVVVLRCLSTLQWV